MNVKIFGREPAAWLGLFGAAVSAAGAFVVYLTPGQEGALNAAMALIVGIVVAASTHDGLSAALLGALKGILALAIAFGLHMSADKQTILYGLAAAAVAMFVRTQAVAPVPPAPPPTIR